MDEQMKCNLCSWTGKRRECIELDPSDETNFDPACPVCESMCVPIKPNASVSIPGGEPGYAPRKCSASSCCGARVAVAGGSEGTNWYECVSCGNPCDLVPVHHEQNTQAEGRS